MSFHASEDITRGFAELQKELEEILKGLEEPEKTLEIGAKELVKDLLKLPKPKSQIRSAKYTHLIDTFAWQHSETHKGEVEVGWGKFYGRMVEKGTVRSGARPHLEPTFERNKDKYYRKMIKHMGLD